MNIQASSSSNKRKAKHQIISFLILVFIIFITEPYYRQPLFDYSVELIETIQGPESNKNYKLMRIAEVFSFLGNSGTFIPIIFLVYNFANIYKTYVLFMTLLFTAMEISLLKMIITSPRPYMINPKIIPSSCEGGWGNPSGHSLASTAFYLTLWHIIFDCNQLRKNLKAKFTALVFIVLFILTIMFSRVVVGAHSLNQILYGGLLGFGLYFFLFYVLLIDTNDSSQLVKIMEIRNLIYLGINSLILLFAGLIYYLNTDKANIDLYNDKINQIEICRDISINKRLQNEGIVTFAVFLGNIGAFIGLKFEYFFTFGENTKNWKQYNFENEEPKDTESLMSKISISKETQWNHTNAFISIVRLIFILILCGLTYLPFHWIDMDSNIYIVLIFKIIIPINCITFSVFYLYKTILRTFRFVNTSLFNLMQDIL